MNHTLLYPKGADPSFCGLLNSVRPSGTPHFFQRKDIYRQKYIRDKTQGHKHEGIKRYPQHKRGLGNPELEAYKAPPYYKLRFYI